MGWSRLNSVFLLPLREKVARVAGRMRGAYAEPGDELRFSKSLIRFKILVDTPHPSAPPTPSPARGEGKISAPLSERLRHRRIDQSAQVAAQGQAGVGSHHLGHEHH